MKYTLGFIGCGNMGGALVRAAAKSLCGDTIAVCDRDASKTEALKNECGVVPTTSEDVAKNAAFVVLGLKPQYMESGIAEFRAILQARTDVTVITMAAGLSIDAIRGYIGADLPVIRIMPNTPVTVGEGMILYAAKDVTEERILANLKENRKGKTTIIIAHRISTIQNADRIFVINNGGILEQGSPKELMEKKGAYYNLYMAQFGDV